MLYKTIKVKKEHEILFELDSCKGMNEESSIYIHSTRKSDIQVRDPRKKIYINNDPERPKNIMKDAIEGNLANGFGASFYPRVKIKSCLSEWLLSSRLFL